MATMKFIKNLILIVLVVVGGWWLLSKMNLLPSLGELLEPKAVQIDETATIVKDIQPLAQLVTVSAYNEIVVDSVVNLPGVTVIQPLMPLIVPQISSLNKAIVIIGKTVAHVGVDLQKITAADIRLSSDTVYLTLPPAQVLDVILNPSDVEIFIEKGKWSPETITGLKNRISALAVEQVVRNGLIEQSQRKAAEILTRFFEATGRKLVVGTAEHRR
jgi:hypothetical protein